jgi:hypothetical protein
MFSNITAESQAAHSSIASHARTCLLHPGQPPLLRASPRCLFAISRHIAFSMTTTLKGQSPGLSRDGRILRRLGRCAGVAKGTGLVPRLIYRSWWYVSASVGFGLRILATRYLYGKLSVSLGRWIYLARFDHSELNEFKIGVGSN